MAFCPSSNLSITSNTCFASSLVGVKISAVATSSRINVCIRGIENAPVLPVPV